MGNRLVWVWPLMATCSAVVASACNNAATGGDAVDAMAEPDSAPRPVRPDAHQQIGEIGPRRDAARPEDARVGEDARPPPADANLADANLADATPPDAAPADAASSGGDGPRPVFADAEPPPADATGPDAVLAPDAGPPIVVDADPMVRLCALEGGCAPAESSGLGLAVCTSLYQGIEDERRAGSVGTFHRSVGAVFDCSTDIADCGGWRACLHQDDARVLACEAGGSIERCDGDFRIDCSANGTDRGEDCAAAGLVCGQDGDNAVCGEALCDAATPPTCENGVQTLCIDGATVRRDCRHSLMLSCRGPGGGPLFCQSLIRPACGPDPDGEGELTCLSEGPPCPPDLGPHCEGNVFVTCDDGRVSTTDCSALAGDTWRCGLGIGVFGATVLGCVRPDAECRGDEPESCDGSRIRFCHLGRWATFDCTSIGLGQCTVGVSAVDDRDVGRCAE